MEKFKDTFEEKNMARERLVSDFQTDPDFEPLVKRYGELSGAIGSASYDGTDADREQAHANREQFEEEEGVVLREYLGPYIEYVKQLNFPTDWRERLEVTTKFYKEHCLAEDYHRFSTALSLCRKK